MVKELVNRRDGDKIVGRRQVSGRDSDLIKDLLFWGSWVVGVAVMINAVLAGSSALEVLLLAGLYALCVIPFIKWYSEGMRWIPLGEVFILLHLPYYVLPAAMGARDWLGFGESTRLCALLGVALFLIVFWILYQSFLRRGWKSLDELPLLRREMRPIAMWGIFIFWIGGSVMQAAHLTPNWSGFRNVFDTLVNALGAVGIAYIFYQMGLGKISGLMRSAALGGFAIGMIAGFANGLLQGNAQTLVVALLAYTLGSKKVPLGAIGLSVLMLLILQLGKAEFRAMSWNQAGPGEEHPTAMQQYQVWLDAGWQNLMPGNDSDSEANSQKILDRTSLVHILAIAMDETPATLPYLKGETYWMLPEMLVPRYFWPDKPRGTVASETIGIYYGIQNEKNADFTGVSVGPLTEGWANFGWFGLAISAAFFGILYGITAKMSRQLLPHQVGWLFACVVLTYSVKMEQCVAEISTSLLQTLLVTLVLLYALSHPPAASVQRKPQAKSARPSLRPATG